MNKTAQIFFKSLGFTLFETIFVLAILGIFMGLSTPYLLGTREKIFLETERDKITNALKVGQQQAIAAYQGHDYTVRFQIPQTYILQPTISPKTVNLNPQINIESFSPSNEVVFAKLTGKPTEPFELVLSSKRFRCRIEISSEGIITASNPEKR